MQVENIGEEDSRDDSGQCGIYFPITTPREKRLFNFFYLYIYFFYITDHHSALDYPRLSFPSLYFSVTDKAPSALFHSDPQLPGAVISDRC